MEMLLTELFPFLILLAVVTFIVYVAQPTKILLQNEELILSGLYGKRVDVRDISAVELLDFLPPVLLRNNGLGLGLIKKGFFFVKDMGRCRLLLNGAHSPYMMIRLFNGEVIIVNHKDPDYINTLASDIRLLMKMR